VRYTYVEVFRGFNSGYKLVLYLLSSGNAYAHFGPHDAWGNAVVEYILFTYPFGGEIMARIDSSSVGRPADRFSVAFFFVGNIYTHAAGYLSTREASGRSSGNHVLHS
jgi:hypothetical protein